MEQAILKTLIYADIFDYPLKEHEIHKWLIDRRATLRQVEKALEKLRVKGKAKRVKDYYFLPGREILVAKRVRRQTPSKKLLKKAGLLTQILKLIPWVKLVGISGGLAMKNADKKDDIDLILITSKNRLWISRLFALGLLSLLGQRRKKGDQGKKIAGKLCSNILLEISRLEQTNKDIFVAHEVLQMKVLWQREDISFPKENSPTVYSKFLENNNWAFKFLPNWVGIQIQNSKSLITWKI